MPGGWGSVALGNSVKETTANARRRTARNPLFSGRRFTDEVVTLCVRWYLRFKLSYRDVAEIAWEMGILVAPSTILRWVIRYAEEFARRLASIRKTGGRIVAR
jgi:transposase-like protein